MSDETQIRDAIEAARVRAAKLMVRPPSLAVIRERDFAVLHADHERLRGLVWQLRDALEFMRACEAAGQAGADDQAVIDALTASQPIPRPGAVR